MTAHAVRSLRVIGGSLEPIIIWYAKPIVISEFDGGCVPMVMAGW